jgi:hypothetical protein
MLARPRNAFAFWLGCAALAGAAFASDPGGYHLMEYSTATWQGSTFWTGGGWLRVGRDWHHPGEKAASVRRFVVPADGKLTVDGRVAKADTGGGDGVNVEIRLDQRVVWQDRIEARDAAGKVVRLDLDARKGQSLRFVVRAGATITCDSTRWDPLVTCADGTKHQASAAFGDRQGHGGWFYEYEGNPGPAAAAGPSARRPGPATLPDMTGLDLPAMVQLEWRIEDGLDDRPQTYSAAIGRHLALTQQLLDDLREGRAESFLASEAAQLQRIAGAAREPATDPRELYQALRQLKRRIALANPLMNFGPLLFAKRSPPAYSHLVMQYFGWRQRPGGGLFILEKPGHSLVARDILAGRLEGGSVLEPSLSWDGQRIAFSWVDLRDAKIQNRPDGDDVAYFHLYSVNVDGSDLKQITRGPADDMMPAWLPDGGIAFTSTRRKGYARCFGGQFGQRWHVYTLHRVEPDGSNLRALSYHDTNEWFPAVTHRGRLLYARWDYIDRDAVTHQNLWLTRPDGTNPLALWGNATPKPHCSFQARPVPNSNKIVFIASAHHSITGGSVVLLDPDIHNNDHGALRRLTPDIRFPEAEGGIDQWYCSPWPLSEKYFLVSYSPLPLVFEPAPNPRNGLGIYLLDAFGNRELIYRDPQIGSTSPIPLTPRQSPPILPPSASDAPTATMLLSDVYSGLGDVPRGSIKQLRIVQILPKTTPTANAPPIGCAGEENARAILGTVPVEPDGSAHFEVPARKPVLFQALDAAGMAYQTMRTLTYAQPGERISCVGCHENRMTAAPAHAPLASRRPASRIDPGPMGGAPFSYVRFIQPIMDKHCVSCHGGQKIEKGVDLTGAPASRGSFTRSYAALTQDPRMVRRFAARNGVQITPPGGHTGAIGSGLMRLVRDHYGVKLADDELRGLSAWIDLNAVFYGSYDPADNRKELRGEPIPMPAIQ